MEVIICLSIIGAWYLTTLTPVCIYYYTTEDLNDTRDTGMKNTNFIPSPNHSYNRLNLSEDIDITTNIESNTESILPNKPNNSIYTEDLKSLPDYFYENKTIDDEIPDDVVSPVDNIIEISEQSFEEDTASYTSLSCKTPELSSEDSYDIIGIE